MIFECQVVLVPPEDLRLGLQRTEMIAQEGITTNARRVV